MVIVVVVMVAVYGGGDSGGNTPMNFLFSFPDLIILVMFLCTT